MLVPEAVRSVLAASGDWAYVDGIADSWFEDNQDVARVVASAQGQKRQARTERILTGAIAPRREKWARLSAETAQWQRAAPDGGEFPWR